MDNSNPLVVLVPTLRTSAWHGEGTPQTRMCELMPLREALEYDSWGADTCIQPIVDHGFTSEHPRIGSGAMASFVHGSRTATLNAVLLDLDYDGHRKPPEGWAESVSEQNKNIPHGWYRSPNGMRIVVIPKQPVPAEKARAYMQWVADQMVLPHFDKTSLEPLRLQRTANALDRDDLPRDFSNMRPLDTHPDVDALALETHIRGVQVQAGATPNPDALAKVTTGELKVIKDTDLRARIKDGLVRARTGERHATLLSTARQLGTYVDDPLTVYRWLLPSAERLFAGEHGRDWRGELWRMVAWALAAETVAVEEQEEVAELAREDSALRMGVTEDRVCERVILAADKFYWVWDETAGHYVGPIGDVSHIHMMLRAHAPALTADRKIGWGFAQLLAMYGTRVNEVAYTYDPEQEGLRGDTFVVRETRVADITPKRHDGVHEWLTALGGDHPDRFLDWLACYPLINQPVCALYIKGEPGIGKGLLATGLAQVFESDEILAYEQLEKFAGQLRRSPLVWADETMGETDSGALRQLVGNNRHIVREMYKPHYTLYGSPRLLITANNGDLLRLKDKPTATDLAAVRQRVGYIEVGDCPKNVLQRLARANDGQKMRDMTTQWIENRDIARHILWLSETRDVEAGDRFLVEGWESALTRRLSISYGDAERVMITVIGAITSEVYDPGLLYQEGSVLVHAETLAKAWKDWAPSAADKPLETRAVARALRQISGDVRKRREVSGKTVAMWEIDGARLLDYADELGVGDREDLHKRITRTAKEAQAGLGAGFTQIS